MRAVISKSDKKPAIILVLLIMFNVLCLTVIFSGQQNKSKIAGFTYIPDPAQTESVKKDSLQINTFKLIRTGNDCRANELLGTRESRIAWAISPNPGESVGSGGKIKLWYNDEHPLTMGKGAVSDPSQNHVVNPNVGDESARDQNGFPYFPALFITDITGSSSDTSGDSENGGIPHKPDEVWGSWKALGASSSLSSPPNNLTLPTGADPFPTVSNLKFREDKLFTRPRETAYGAEIIWEVDNLGLAQGHSYRAQFVIHDGDQEGDIGVGCATIKLD